MNQRDTVEVCCFRNLVETLYPVPLNYQRYKDRKYCKVEVEEMTKTYKSYNKTP